MRDDYPGTNLRDYHFPLRPDVMVRLTLPGDLTLREVRRITRMLESLTVGGVNCGAAEGSGGTPPDYQRALHGEAIPPVKLGADRTQK